MRLSRLSLLLAALALAACAARPRGPAFLDAEGGAQRLRLAGQGRYTLHRPMPAADRVFYLRYRPAGSSVPGSASGQEAPDGGGAELRVLDPAGGILARRALAGLREPTIEVELLVPLPAGSRVAGLALYEAGDPPPQVLEAGLTRALVGFELAGSRLRLGTGVRSLDLSGGAVEVRLAAEAFGDEGWRIELDYALGSSADWADLRLLEAGLEPGRRAQARLVAVGVGRRTVLEQDALPGEQHLFLYPATIGFAPVRLALRALGGGLAAVRRLEVVWEPEVPVPAQEPAGPALAPLPADPATVLQYDPRFWRQPDYELFAWARFPGILILDTADYQVQDRFFKRLAFFVEKSGYRGRLVSDQEVSGLHGYNAHDYRAEDLARFFQTADAQGFALNREEELLRAMMTANGLLDAAGRAGGQAGDAGSEGAILSISRESSDLLRAHLLTHEAFHGLYFLLPLYREACQAAWRDLEEAERRFWRLFLEWGSYDYRDEFLAANEMQAYLFQQPRSGLGPYFRLLTAERLERAFPGEAAWLGAHLAAGGGGFEAAFDRLSPILRREARLQGGRVVEWKKAGD
jgi:hypothetical protein